ncbi:cysteine proteinase [Sistotremastrum niveocremeum HHB9708]|uniref:ubiquitinyl hydrolase 1 n=1 Tax=Sistotremastrum niveocremeum HHB9708 TaxID=1314777 RepID=A0A164UI86_9AGAM|nr:cysteine proteinase [Sistotremastrum niveocremeum HHB9708]
MPDLIAEDAPAWGDKSTFPWTPLTGFDSTVNIDGRDDEEEMKWWNSDVRERKKRPGPGMLPPLLAQEVRNANPSLHAVNATVPPIANRQASSPSSPPSVSPPIGSSHATSPPTFEDIQKASPHPNAYFCPEHYSWVVVSWKSSQLTPQVIPSFKGTLPDQDRRRTRPSCLDDPHKPNRTHHFHHYPQAVSSTTLHPPITLFRGKTRSSSPAITKSRGDTAASSPSPVEETQAAPSNVLLDLYVCCQCSFSALVSGAIQGVIPPKHVESLTRLRRETPLPNINGQTSVVMAWEVILRIIENNLWKGEVRRVSTTGKAFQKLGWNSTVMRIFDSLGYDLPDPKSEDSTIGPPDLDPSNPGASENKAKLLRAWLEIGAYLSDYRQRHVNELRGHTPYSTAVQISDADPKIRKAIGAHQDQIPQGASGLESVVTAMSAQFKELGMAYSTFSPELLEFAYRSQCRCDPAKTPVYFGHLTHITTFIANIQPTQGTALENLVALETSRGRWGPDAIRTSYTALGFGAQHVLRVDWNEEIDDDFTFNAWKDAVRRTWVDSTSSSQKRRDLNEALRILAESRGSSKLLSLLDQHKGDMDPDQAYRTIDVPQQTEDGMLLMVFQMRVDEMPSQVESMRQALAVIADQRDSKRIRTYLETGSDPGDISHDLPPEWPRGLNQLGNTCYLNSLLQYFYTIKDLREAIVPLKAMENEKWSDDDLKRHRVGGRMVTRREIMRSRKFVSQLSSLFTDLECSTVPSVTPSLELAKLALVTSKDEEEDEHDLSKSGTESSNSTDATLVDEPLPVSGSVLPLSILGKRPREGESAATQTPKISGTSESIVKDSQEGPQGTADAEMHDGTTDNSRSKPPPLPPRRKTEPTSDSLMMFGKQHDVAECMDNCLFQIEAALLRSDDDAEVGGASQKSLVKRLFYGKIRQRITPPVSDRPVRSTTHERDDFFSHLPVNVSEEGFDLYDGLSGYFDDSVEFQGHKAKMEVTLLDLPPVLQIQLQRVQFNRVLQQAYKSQEYVKFEENLYVDRFLESANPSKKQRSKVIQSELSRCRDRIYALVKDEQAPFAEHLDVTSKFLIKHSFLDTTQELSEFLSQEREAVTAELGKLREEIKRHKEDLEALWADERSAAYELTSVFIHRGSSPSWGHYFFYARCLPDRPDSWFKMNDSEVTMVSKDEVLADSTGSTANPYLLVYARKDAQVIQTAKRDPVSDEKS